MKKSEIKQIYECPKIEIFYVKLDNQLMDTSFPNDGGHKKADDDNQELNAKQTWSDFGEDNISED